MDLRPKVSPLLSPRPDFLGVGWGRQRANIFFEVFSISCISPSISSFKCRSFPHYKNKISGPLSNNTNRHNKQSEGSIKNVSFKNLENAHKEIGHEATAAYTEVVSDWNENKCLPYDPVDNSMCKYTFMKETLEVYRVFQKLNISFETEIYRNKEQRLDVDNSIFYCKNLFLKDRKGQFYLIIFHEDTEMNLKQLRKTLNAYRNFNFATAEEMMSILHTEPGGVTPLALMNESAMGIRMVISKSVVQDGAQLMFHPMDAKLATKITLPSLLRFLKHFGHAVQFID